MSPKFTKPIPLSPYDVTGAVVHRDERLAHAAIDDAMDELRGVERAMTRFTTTSDVGRANLDAARRPVRVAGATALVVGEALRWAEATRGAFDPAIGEAVALWDVAHRHEPPPAPDVSRLAGRTLFHRVEVAERSGDALLLFHDADVRIDLGAIAKGYGVDRAIAALRERGIEHALVDVGGDLYALGSAPSGDRWRIGIQDPDDPRAIIGEVDVADEAIATSGTYVQFFRYRGHRYHHLLDPVTAAPRATAVRSLTIGADSCMHADVAATALFGMPAEEAVRVLAARAPGGRVVRVA
ncbi:MAG: FAD:protein FMN transferase [Gemmatimonadaceae bacterium]|nr:FAD:protein FMN transferase [Gemmatimonadaceae bacterium]